MGFVGLFFFVHLRHSVTDTYPHNTRHDLRNINTLIRIRVCSFYEVNSIIFIWDYPKWMRMFHALGGNIWKVNCHKCTIKYWHVLLSTLAIPWTILLLSLQNSYRIISLAPFHLWVDVFYFEHFCSESEMFSFNCVYFFVVSYILFAWLDAAELTQKSHKISLVYCDDNAHTQKKSEYLLLTLEKKTFR